MKKGFFLALSALSVLFFFVSACKKDRNDAPPLADADPGQNKYLITTSDEKVLKVDPDGGNFEVVYSFDAGNRASGFDYDNGRVYVGDEKNTINSIDINSKSTVWRVPFLIEEPLTGSRVQVVVKEGTVYTIGYSGLLAAVDAAGGRPLWTYVVNPDFSEEQNLYYPTLMSVVGDRVVVGSAKTDLQGEEKNSVHLLERSTGRMIWKTELVAGRRLTGAVKVSGNTVLIPQRDLTAIDVSGRVLWNVSMGDPLEGAGTPVVSGDKVLVHGCNSGGSGGRLFCLSLSSGKKQWEIESGANIVRHYTPTVIENKYVVGMIEKGTEQAPLAIPFMANIGNGKKVWENAAVRVKSSGVYANGRLFFYGEEQEGSNRKGLMCLDAATGKFLWVNEAVSGSSNEDAVMVAENGVFKPAAQETDQN